MDDEAKKWLKEHARELEGAFKIWPEPKFIPNLGIYKDINVNFDSIVGNPDNWEEILYRKDLLNKWIIPHAILLYGKKWFDKFKIKNSISNKICLPLFTHDEKNEATINRTKLENTIAGKAIITRIIYRVAFSLKVYLKNFKSAAKKPSSYIIKSIKNEFMKSISKDLGYRMRRKHVCPYCLHNNYRIILQYNGSKQFSCPKCIDSYKSLENNNNLNNIKDSVGKFINFIGITCVCPSDNCKGHFIPLNCIDFNKWEINYSLSDKIKIFCESLKKIKIPLNTNRFIAPPKEILSIPIKCPYCYTEFTLQSAFNSKSGFKNKSGMITGLPKVDTFIKKMNYSDYKSCFLNENISDRIIINKNINILIEETIITMSRINKNTTNGLISWYFYETVIDWLIKYNNDTGRYFFNYITTERSTSNKEKKLHPGKNNKKWTIVLKGREISIHQSLFEMWMDKIESHIEEFKIINPKIESLKDFKWFCRNPRFSDGPESSFNSIINSSMQIKNMTDVIDLKSKIKPRIAKILEIKKDGKDYINDIKFWQWYLIRIKKNSELKPGDCVKVKVLLIPGHPQSATMQRIIRLRTKIFSFIINKIKLEEKNSKRDIEFWTNRAKIVQKARETTGIKTFLKE